MSELLPSRQAAQIRSGASSTTSRRRSRCPTRRRGLRSRDFLDDPDDGIFRGPYVRAAGAVPAADDGWRDALDWYEGPTPYGHQAAAFRRLSSREPRRTARRIDKPRPLPTLVTTGTGSGKTEAFLYPILDHVLRAKRDGRHRHQGAHPLPDERARQRPGAAPRRAAHRRIRRAAGHHAPAIYTGQKRRRSAPRSPPTG